MAKWSSQATLKVIGISGGGSEVHAYVDLHTNTYRKQQDSNERLNEVIYHSPHPSNLS